MRVHRFQMHFPNSLSLKMKMILPVSIKICTSGSSNEEKSEENVFGIGNGRVKKRKLVVGFNCSRCTHEHVRVCDGALDMFKKTTKEKIVNP